MNNHPQKLKHIAEQIRDIDDQRTKLHRERGHAITAAKNDGMSNREVAKLLGVHEPTVYRMSRITNTDKGKQ